MKKNYRLQNIRFETEVVEETTLEEALECVTKEIKRVTPCSFEFE